MGLGIGVYCKVCGEQLTSLETIDQEERCICKECDDKKQALKRVLLEEKDG